MVALDIKQYIEDRSPEIEDWCNFMSMLLEGKEYPEFEDEVLRTYYKCWQLNKDIPCITQINDEILLYISSKIDNVVRAEHRYDPLFIQGIKDNEINGEYTEAAQYADEVFESYYYDFFGWYDAYVQGCVCDILSKYRLTYIYENVVRYQEYNGRIKEMAVMQKEHAAQQVFFETAFSNTHSLGAYL